MLPENSATSTRNDWSTLLIEFLSTDPTKKIKKK